MYMAYSPDQEKQRKIQNDVQHLERWKHDCLGQDEQLSPSYNRLQDAFGVTVLVQSSTPQRSRELVKTIHQDVFRGVVCNVVSDDGRRISVRFGFEQAVPRCAECDRLDNAYVAVRNRRWDYYYAGQLTSPVSQRFDALEDTARNAVFSHRRQAHKSTDTFL